MRVARRAAALWLGVVAAAPFACNASPTPEVAANAIEIPSASATSATASASTSSAIVVLVDASAPASPASADPEAAEASRYGTIGLRDPNAPTQGIGLGSFGGTVDGGTKAPKSPKLRVGTVNVNGQLPPEVVQRIVRQNFGRFRLCYEAGLRKQPKLAGNVTVRFRIDATGGVSTTSDGGSKLADPSTITCIVRAFGGLSFPQPEDGKGVVVDYTVELAPPD